VADRAPGGKTKIVGKSTKVTAADLSGIVFVIIVKCFMVKFRLSTKGGKEDWGFCVPGVELFVGDKTVAVNDLSDLWCEIPEGSWGRSFVCHLRHR
jgi:hypothetical protein